ncbi:MAG TPA: HAD family phosphatase [Ferruginibacter sp.]|nr:HAD family phosphatase [Ferruginibacter sp.]
MKGIKNIIFDLGEVLLNIDTRKTNEAFEKLGVRNFKNNYSLNKADELFDNLERGKVSEPEFFDAIRRISHLQLKDDDIRAAWNALLLDFRMESLQHLDTLKSRYSLYLLSNTNSIHHAAFHRSFTEQTGGRSFDDYFNKAYYSHQTGFRKPDKEIYDLVLSDAGIVADETLFIDDLLKNIEAAAALGIRTHQLLPEERIETMQW